MRAIVISSYGDPEVLQIQDRPVPTLQPGEVLVSVMAAGINRPDVSQRQGKYPPPSWAPQDIPGLEVAGVIEKVGPDVTRWKSGDLVCALVSGGGYAQYVAVPGGQCLPIPQGWSFVEAASIPETFFTVWHNVFQRGQLQKGERLLVHGGSGGIGMTAIQLGHAFEARVFATAGSDVKCEACLSLGAAIAINYKREDFEEVLRQEGADVILDMIGGSYISRNLSLLHDDGRLVFINSSRGGKVEMDPVAIMRRRITITGSTLRVRDGHFKAALADELEKHVWPLMANRVIRPVIFKEFPLEEAAAAHALMESSDHIGKIVLVVK